MELATTAAQDAGARARLLRLHRQPDDGRLRARGAAHGARGRDAAAGRLRARRARAWRWASSRVFDMAGIDVGVNVHKANAAPLSAGPDLLPGRRRAVRGRAARAEDRQGLLPLRAGRPHASRRSRRRSRILRATRARARRAQRAHSDAGDPRALPVSADQRGHSHPGRRRRACAPPTSTWSGLSGYGFPRYRGGPMFYADTIGLHDAARRACEKYRDDLRPDALGAGAVARGAGRARGARLAEWERAR